jgi:hypothetical protein
VDLIKGIPTLILEQILYTQSQPHILMHLLLASWLTSDHILRPCRIPPHPADILFLMFSFLLKGEERELITITIIIIFFANELVEQYSTIQPQNGGQYTLYYYYYISKCDKIHIL